jgi:uncharacterized protein YndB with AHSA1/START domain
MTKLTRGMTRVEESRYFPVAREEAFDYITDPRNWNRYWPNVVAVPELEVAQWRQPGDTMRLRMRLAARIVDLHMTLDRIDRPSRVEYHTAQRGLPTAEHVRIFEPAGDGFVYRLGVSYRPRRGLTGVLDRTLVRRGIRRALRTTLDNLDRGFLPQQSSVRMEPDGSS